MRARTETRLNETWYGGAAPPLWLRSLVPAYRAGQRLDRWWQMRQRPDDLPAGCIVVVGNLTVGGTGKTPLVIRLCRLLHEAGLRPGVISRGHGSREPGVRLVSPASDPVAVGDEPLLIAQQSGVPVIVAADRCAAARALLKRGVGVVISDDGLQHYRLPRDIEICVIDGSRGLGNGHLLPAGPLREPVERLQQVDHIVVNGDANPLPAIFEIVHMTLAGGLLHALDGGQNWRLSQFAGCRVNAVAGIGNPRRFFDLLRHARIKVIEHAFPDHHDYRRGDFDGMSPDLPILMTEKDAVKCRKLALPNAWYLSIEAVLPADWEETLVRQVLARLEQTGPSQRDDSDEA
ncbi:MAG: tetraacyldisaccharide 4'-kinase [Xanthomonadales bacterium]|nr:tetraacyldisaccharide 4'-kinase [Xanthomonadales bacterium]